MIQRYLSLIVLIFTASQLAFAQDMPRFSGWADAEHFLLLKKGEEEMVQVNARTGKESPYEMKVDASLSEQLPAGLRASFRNTTTSASGRQLVLKDQGDLFLFKEGSTSLRQLTATPSEENNPTFSPDETHIAYTRNRNLFVMDLETGLERQLTQDGSDLIYNGWASWVYYEEILGRSSRYKAFYWSPDSKKIAFMRFDDTPVHEFPIFHHEGEDMTHGYLEETRYPKSGDDNPLVELGIADVQSGETQWIDKNDELEYLAWVFWTPNADRLIVQQMNRDQNHLVLYSADPNTGKQEKMYEEKQKTWLEFYTEFHFLKDDNGFILLSDRDGWENIYHHDMNGQVVKQITDFDWRINSITEIDEENGRVFFSGTGEDGTESHFFVINLDGTGLKQLSKEEGMHRVSLSPGGQYFLSQYNSHSHPGKMILGDTAGKKYKVIAENKNNPNEEAGVKVEMFTIPTEDGFDMPAMWVLPPDFDKNKKYPIVFTIYGGPNAGTVYDRFRNYSTNFMTQNDIIVFAVDHRASGKFGKKGLDYMHRNLGKWEMNDYIEAVKWLRKQGFIDENKVGISGGSYGGYMTAMALTYAADYFTHGVARASVTDWRLYDNVYTERYMDRPIDNPEGYKFGSVMTHADKLKGELLIVHGTIDDNVHMQQSIQLISKLQDLGKDFEMMVYPGGRHGWGGAKRVHSNNLANKFWTKHFVGSSKKEVRP
jgi:dipeptidyl-peptidase-4